MVSNTDDCSAANAAICSDTACRNDSDSGSAGSSTSRSARGGVGAEGRVGHTVSLRMGLGALT